MFFICKFKAIFKGLQQMLQTPAFFERVLEGERLRTYLNFAPLSGKDSPRKSLSKARKASKIGLKWHLR